MFETLSRLWLEGRLPEIGLDRAIAKGWITQEQKEIIMAQKPVVVEA